MSRGVSHLCRHGISNPNFFTVAIPALVTVTDTGFVEPSVAGTRAPPAPDEDLDNHTADNAVNLPCFGGRTNGALRGLDRIGLMVNRQESARRSRDI
jgi:hypothetical protein